METIINKAYSRNETKDSVINAFFREHMGIKCPVNMNTGNVYNIRLNKHLVTDGYLMNDTATYKVTYWIHLERVVDGHAFNIYTERVHVVMPRIYASTSHIMSLANNYIEDEMKSMWWDEEGFITIHGAEMRAFENGANSIIMSMGLY